MSIPIVSAAAAEVLRSLSKTTSQPTIDGDDRLLELLWIKVELHSRTMYVGALYHPPHPIYATSLLTARLEHTVEVLVHSDPEALLVLGGDLNELGDSTVVEATGLIPLVHQPTRGGNTLDRLYVSEECFATVKVLNSAIKTDHRAIVAVPHGPVITRGKVLTRVVYRRRSPPQHAALLRCFSEVDLSALIEASDP